MKQYYCLPLLFIIAWTLGVAGENDKKSFIKFSGPGYRASIVNESFIPIGSKLLKNAHEKTNRAGGDILNSVQGLIDRVLLRAEVKFRLVPKLELIKFQEINEQEMDVFEVDRDSQENLVLRGSSGVALASAFGHYLRYYTKSDFHWENGGNYSFGNFPKSLDVIPLPESVERVVFLSNLRYYLNTCTMSYSLVWKDWSQWEQEIDWMAMNGFNLPLAFVGQEIVWQALWRNYGVSDEGLQQYFTGPAFLAWQRMSNIRAFAGPLSQSWIDQQTELQKNILNRYAELQITPVMPAFNGVVPAEMQSLFPDSKITRLGSAPGWNDFPDQQCCNYFVDFNDPLFIEIGQKFIGLQAEIFGDVAMSHVYNCDTFNENKPASSDQAYLSAASSVVYQSKQSTHPETDLLMKGWMFFHHTFWTDDTISYYLDGVPDEGMIILDLSSEDRPVWDKISANRKQFVWCMLHNYGGRRAIYGNLTLLNTDPISVMQKVPQYFQGTGMTMEAIDQNPVVYEFMSEVAMRRDITNVNSWVQKYVQRRYELAESQKESLLAANSAWELLLKTSYSGDVPLCQHPSCHRESILTKKPYWFNLTQSVTVEAGPLVNVWAQLQLVRASYNSSAFRYDLVDVGRQVLTNLFYDLYSVANAAVTRKDTKSLVSLRSNILQLLSDLDSLLATHEGFLLGRWIAEARRWAKDANEADLFDYNARNQVTLWGYEGEIDDYASKNWAGLVGEYYRSRWALLLDMTVSAFSKGVDLDLNEYSAEELKGGQHFCEAYDHKFSTTVVGNTAEVSFELLGKYGLLYKSPNAYVKVENRDVSASYNLVSHAMWTNNLQQMKWLCDSDPACTGFTSTGMLKTSTEHHTISSGVDLYKKKL